MDDFLTAGKGEAHIEKQQKGAKPFKMYTENNYCQLGEHWQDPDTPSNLLLVSCLLGWESAEFCWNGILSA